MPLPGGSAFRGRPAGLSSGGAQTCALLTEGEGLARRDEQVGDRQGRPEACQARAFGQWDGCQRQRAVAVAGRGHHEARRRTLQRGQAEAQDRLQAVAEDRHRRQRQQGRDGVRRAIAAALLTTTATLTTICAALVLLRTVAPCFTPPIRR